jgi:hypothetical protein
MATLGIIVIAAEAAAVVFRKLLLEKDLFPESLLPDFS